MNINITMFVQVINFFIAYVLFRLILLKPAYREIMQEQYEKEKLEGMVDVDKRSIEEIRKQRAAHWQDCQQVCSKEFPRPIREANLFRGIVPSISVHIPSSKELRSTTEQIAQAIILQIGGTHGTD